MMPSRADILDRNFPDEIDVQSVNDDELCASVRIPDDTERALNLYQTTPLFRETIRDEIRRQNDWEGRGYAMYRWQVTGFLYSHRGETIALSSEDLSQ